MSGIRNHIVTLCLLTAVALPFVAGSAHAQQATIDALTLVDPVRCAGNGRVRATITINDCSNPVVSIAAPGNSGAGNLCLSLGTGTHDREFSYSVLEVPPNSPIVFTLVLQDGFDGPLIDTATLPFNCSTGGPIACSDTPLASCRSAGFSKLALHNSFRNRSDKVSWLWRKGEATTAADYADPTTDAAYSLCIYNNGVLSAANEIAPDASLWKSIKGGFKHKENVFTGKTALTLKAGAEGKAKITAKISGLIAPDPLFPFEAPLITIQLVNEDSGLCFESVFDAEDIKKNKATQAGPLSSFSGHGTLKGVAK